MSDDKKNLIDPKMCPTKVAAEIFGCSGQHLRDLAKAGEISQTGRGKYDLSEIAKYKLQSASDSQPTEFQKAKLKHEQEKARAKKMENDEHAKRLIPAQEVSNFVHGFTSELMRFIESLKKKTGASLDHDTRKKFFKAHEDERSAMASRLKAWASDSLAIGGTDQDPDNQ